MQSTLKLEDPETETPVPDLALVAHAPPPKPNVTLYVPSDRPVIVTLFPPDATCVPEEFVTLIVPELKLELI